MKGAHSPGAKKEGKPGLFEMAHTGTLFLDEVAELPLAFQVKLLRAIQDKRLRDWDQLNPSPSMCGSLPPRTEILLKCSRRAAFREDLYYRLMVVPVNVVPLRDRKEDIPLLVRHFLNEFN